MEGTENLFGDSDDELEQQNFGKMAANFFQGCKEIYSEPNNEYICFSLVSLWLYRQIERDALEQKLDSLNNDSKENT